VRYAGIRQVTRDPPGPRREIRVADLPSRSGKRDLLATGLRVPHEKLSYRTDVSHEAKIGTSSSMTKSANATAGYADPAHPVRCVVDAHRRWFKQATQDLLDEINVLADLAVI
jgi:hypothetical protein